jgi:AraC-like DNA-binding protein
LFLFIASNLKQSLEIVDSRPDLFGNPLSILWWPQKRSISDIDLIQCAQRGIDCLTNKKSGYQVSFSKIKGRLRAISHSQSIYQRDMLSAAPLVQPINQESKLVNEIVTYLGKNSLNEEFSIEKMGTDLGMSRTKFFNRVKAITGQSPSRLVMNFRLKKAALLLDGKRTNVSEVAFEVGFSSTAYFTKCFKDQFGKSPSQYIKIRTHTKLLNPLNIDPFTVSVAV